MHKMHYMKIKTVLIATVVTSAVILMGSINGNAFGSTQQDNNLYSLIAIWGSEGTGDGEFAEPHGVAVDSSDNVYIVDTKNFRIQKLTVMVNSLNSGVPRELLMVSFRNHIVLLSILLIMYM